MCSISEALGAIVTCAKKLETMCHCHCKFCEKKKQQQQNRVKCSTRFL